MRAVLITVVLFLTPILANAGPPLPVDHAFDFNSSAVNVQHIREAGYAGTLKARRYYHFKFNDGWIVRYYFVSKMTFYPFQQAGKPVKDELTRQDMEDMQRANPYGNSYYDSVGGLSFWATSVVGGFTGVVTITDCTPDC